jgi:hypothetical protein
MPTRNIFASIARAPMGGFRPKCQDRTTLNQLSIKPFRTGTALVAARSWLIPTLPRHESQR